MTKLKNENTDTINRAIHSAMGDRLRHDYDVKDCLCRCGTYFTPANDATPCSKAIVPNFTIPGQPLEDAKAWAKDKFGALKFAMSIDYYIGKSRTVHAYLIMAEIATLPALDMANIIFGLINEDK